MIYRSIRNSFFEPGSFGPAFLVRKLVTELGRDWTDTHHGPVFSRRPTNNLLNNLQARRFLDCYNTALHKDAVTGL